MYENLHHLSLSSAAFLGSDECLSANAKESEKIAVLIPYTRLVPEPRPVDVLL